MGQALGTKRMSHQQEQLSSSTQGTQWHQGAKSGEGQEARGASWNMEAFMFPTQEQLHFGLGTCFFYELD